MERVKGYTSMTDAEGAGNAEKRIIAEVAERQSYAETARTGPDSDTCGPRFARHVADLTVLCVPLLLSDLCDDLFSAFSALSAIDRTRFRLLTPVPPVG